MDMSRPPLPLLEFERIGPQVGTRLPDIVLPNQRGELVDIHAARGSFGALVIFYRSASW
jgi:peroxiredoxin